MSVRNELLLGRLKRLFRSSDYPFKVNTPDGKLIVFIIEDKESYDSEDEYDIAKYVEVRREDGTLFSTLDYRNCLSAIGNGGALYLKETRYYPPDKLHPEGYEILYFYSNYENDRFVNFIVNNACYCVKAGAIFVNHKCFNVKNNILRNKLNDQYTVGIDMESGEIFIYFKANNRAAEIELSIEESREQIEALEIDLLAAIEDTKQIINIYQQNKALLETYHSEETLTIIMKTMGMRPLAEVGYKLRKSNSV